MAVSLTQSRDLGIDLLRGVAVICMVQFHTVDSFAHPQTRAGWLGQASVFFGGGAAPLFLTLAGLGASLGWFAKGRRSLPLVQRGLEIWSIALLFRVQEWALGGEGASSSSLIRVDVLNCIGASLVVLGALLALVKRLPDRAVALCLMAAAAFFILLAPVVTQSAWITWLPAPLSYYLGGPGHLSLFPLFGWTGVACLGAAFGAVVHIGVPLARAASYALGTYGLILAARMLFPTELQFDALNHNIVFTLERCALSLGLLSVVHLLPARRVLLQLGRHSLLIYWVHVELVYGLWLHSKKATLGPAAVFCGALAVLSAMWILSYRPRKIEAR